MYQIECSYRTGDSFKSHDETEVLEFTWDDLDMAKGSLARIKEHYLWYDARNTRYAKKSPKPK